MQSSGPASVDLSFLESGEIPAGGLSDAQFDALVDAAVGTDIRVDVIMKMLGLWHVRDTVVGNELLRGVSGGERHRVTTAEMLVGPRRILLMDEISTGVRRLL
jgi:ABC-type Mn2+/Zn2+ transport system ATPase subunit